MSLKPATSCKEGVEQYCNYGYDKNLYSSYEDCMSKKMQECDTTGDNSAQPLSDSELNENVKQGECYGVSPLRVRCWKNEYKWAAIIGGTLALYYILHKTGSLK
jgi:hypothetical protein